MLLLNKCIQLPNHKSNNMQYSPSISINNHVIFLMITIFSIITFNQLCSTAHLPIKAVTLQEQHVILCCKIQQSSH